MCSNCQTVKDDAFDKILNKLRRANNLKLLQLYDITNDQLKRFFECKIKANCLTIWPSDDDFMEVLPIKNELNDLKLTTNYPAEILIGKYEMNNVTSNVPWVKYCNKNDIKLMCEELNERKNTKEFWEKIISEAISSNQMTKFARSKLMFIGKGRAGKTSTIKSLLNQDFSDKEESTVVADSEGQIKVTTRNVVLHEQWKPQPLMEHGIKTDFNDDVTSVIKHES